jgi:GNAT superfamily N-acetyltransferase
VLLKDLGSIVAPKGEGDLRMEELGRRHLPALSELNRERGQRRADKRFAAYLDQGFHGFVAFRDRDAIGYYWWVDREARDRFPDLRDLELGIELAEGDVYGSDFFLLERHRGKGTAGHFLFAIETSLAERGYRRLWGYAVADNRPARWLYATRGYEPVWAVLRRKLLLPRRALRLPPPAGRSGAAG